MNTTTGIVGPLFGRNKHRFSMLAAPCWNLLIFPIFRPAEASGRQIGHLRVLKLRISDLRLIKLPKTEGFITTRSVSEGFPATLLKPQTLNPSLTRRVGIVPNAQLQSSLVAPGPDGLQMNYSERKKNSRRIACSSPSGVPSFASSFSASKGGCRSLLTMR